MQKYKKQKENLAKPDLKIQKKTHCTDKAKYCCSLKRTLWEYLRIRVDRAEVEIACDFLQIIIWSRWTTECLQCEMPRSRDDKVTTANINQCSSHHFGFKINVVIVQLIKLSCHRFAFDHLTYAIFYIEPMREIGSKLKKNFSFSQIKNSLLRFITFCCAREREIREKFQLFSQ